MFDVGDVITGTPENNYGVTTRGAVCKVIEAEDCEPGEIGVEIIDVDEELVKEGIGSYMKHIVFNGYFDGYVGHTYIVNEEQFEYYEPKAKLVDSSELIDFIDGM